MSRLEKVARPNTRSKKVRLDTVRLMNTIPEDTGEDETDEDDYRDDCIEGGQCVGQTYEVERIVDVQDRYVKVRMFLVKW